MIIKYDARSLSLAEMTTHADTTSLYSAQHYRLLPPFAEHLVCINEQPSDAECEFLAKRGYRKIMSRNLIFSIGLRRVCDKCLQTKCVESTLNLCQDYCLIMS